MVIHGDTVYLAGQVAVNAPGASYADQTKDILATIDKLLGEAGTDKSKLLAAELWITDMRHFADMNEVWDAWVDPANPPARACVEARLAASQFQRRDHGDGGALGGARHGTPGGERFAP